ncbi:MAG: phosphoglucomutase, partial [Gammaproteobacteria bacterium]
MSIRVIKSQPYNDQRPGTSGLRKKTNRFMLPGYLENYVQSIFDVFEFTPGGTVVIGGDGRYFNSEAIQVIIKICAANGVGRVLLGRHGILSTPAASCIIRRYRAVAGFILSASHNPGGQDEDFGIKFNVESGGPAAAVLTSRIFLHSQQIRQYKIFESPGIDLDTMESQLLGSMKIDVIDPVDDYANLLQQLFDFDAIARLIKQPDFNFRFDAMNAVNGSYAKEIFGRRLQSSNDSLLRCTPLPDFGGIHPDPNLVYAKDLVDDVLRSDGPNFGAATDGDGDRNLILGRGQFVSPGDSLAILTANAFKVPGYKGGARGVARSMPTSTAADRVAAKLGIESFETPTGWKYFGNLLDSGRITLCGEEAFGTSSNHIREKDGLWAILFWMNLMAVTGKSIAKLVSEHWTEFGRTYYTRHDYDEVPEEGAKALISGLKVRLVKLKNQQCQGLKILNAD